MKSIYRKGLGLAVAVTSTLGLLTLAASVQAGATIEISDNQSFSIGMGMRASFTSVEDAADTGTDPSMDVALDDVRLYINGKLNDEIGVEFNTNKSGTTVGIIDAVVKYSLSDTTNIWVGRHLPPSGRTNMSGPYYLGSWYFPVVAMGYGNYYPGGGTGAGRDDGAVFWGLAADQRLKYKVGLYKGEDGSAANSAGATAKQDNLLLATRVAYSFWDKETGYYNASTYYGAKDILSVGVTLMAQSEAATATDNTGDFGHLGVDFLFEKSMGGNVVTAEAGYYDYDRDGLGTATNEGDGYFVLGAYQIGKWKPNVRIQTFSAAATAVDDVDRLDIGVDYIIDGHNARVSLNYTDNFTNAAVDTAEVDALTVGLQLQI